MPEASVQPMKLQRICHVCGGFGKEGGCPRCGLTLRNASLKKTMHLDIPADIIPIPYQGKLWEHQVDEASSLKFQEFDSALVKVHTEFLQGRVPSFSLFIAAPPKYGKQEFVYSCMQLAIAQKFTVSPYFSTSDWRRLYRVSQVNPFYKMFDKYQWDKLLCVDVVFISVDHSEDKYDVIPLMKDILDARSRMSKSTVFISDVKLEDLTSVWGGNDYNMIFNSDTNRDFARYPVILQRF